MGAPIKLNFARTSARRKGSAPVLDSGSVRGASPVVVRKKKSDPKKWENRLLQQIQAAGLPEPTREFLFASGAKIEGKSRKWASDFAWPEERLLVEVEGGVFTQGRHTRGAGYEGDCEKYNWCYLLGWGLLRFTPSMIKRRKAVRLIALALGRELPGDPPPTDPLPDGPKKPRSRRKKKVSPELPQPAYPLPTGEE